MWFFDRWPKSRSRKAEWISRDGNCEGDPVSTLINVTARSMIGHPLFAHYLRVSVPFHDADAKGLPTPAEDLDAVEVVLRRALEAGRQSIHVATTTFRKERSYLFYTQDMHASFGRLAQIMDDTINREVRAEAKPDPGWDFYASLAF